MDVENYMCFDKNGDLFYNKWVEWRHGLVPNNPKWLRDFLRILLLALGHCLTCTALDGCYFTENNVPKRLHDFCDCDKVDISFNKVKEKASADCDIRKFTEYVFKEDNKSKGKNQVFYSLGFSVNDSTYLKNQFCKQAKEEYLKGNYILKTLDARGQRLAIPICLNGKEFYSGWMMEPEGKLRNTTPFSGWVK